MSKKKRNREHITRESFERNRYEPLPNYKADEQVARLDNVLVQLEADYDNNKDEIIKTQENLINRLQIVLSELDEQYRNQLDSLNEELQKTRTKVSTFVHRIQSIEETTDALIQEVNNNTTRLNELITQINEEKERTRQLAILACNSAIDGFNEMLSNPIYFKFCYYKIKSIELSISKINESGLSEDARYAIAVSVLGTLAEIRSLSEIEWNKFNPVYESLRKEANEFRMKMDNCRKVTLEEWANIEIDIDFWTENGYTTLSENFKRFQDRIEVGRNAQGYNTPEVKLDSKTLNVFDKQLLTMVTKAKEKATHSLRRKEAGEDSLAFLESHDFIKKTCQFESEDERRPYILEAVHRFDEWKVTLVFATDNQERWANCLVLHNGFIDPNAYAEFVNILISALQREYRIQCMIPNKQIYIDVNYDEEVLTTDGTLNEKIRNILYN